MRLRASISALLMAALATAAAGICPGRRQGLRGARKKHAAASIKAAKADSGAFVGKVIEIRGRVAGLSKSETDETSQSMIVCTPEDGSYVIEVDSLPEGGMNSELACLVTVGEGSKHSLSDLRLLCCTYLVDLARAEEAAKTGRSRLAAKPTPAKAKPAQTTSRNRQRPASLTSDDYVRAYSSAMKRFNRKLSDSQAEHDRPQHPGVQPQV